MNFYEMVKNQIYGKRTTLSKEEEALDNDKKAELMKRLDILFDKVAIIEELINNSEYEAKTDELLVTLSEVKQLLNNPKKS